MNWLEENGKKLKDASKILGVLSTLEKNNALNEIKKSLIENMDKILQANDIDIKNGRNKGMHESLIDRLMLNEERILSIANSIDTVIKLDDPVAKIQYGKTMENGMVVCKKTVPIGVLSIIYESRPNVTVDASVLAIKSGNTVLLRGSSSAINSNKAVVEAIQKGLKQSNVPVDSCILVEDTSRELVLDILKLNKYLDLIIPRGGAELIDFVTKNATVPTIETGVGNCHLFVDETADLNMAFDILENGKVQRPSVCNSLETLLVHKKIANEFLKTVYEKLGSKVTFYGCEETRKIIDNALEATSVEYEKEFLDFVLAVKVVKSMDEAISHIEKYSSGHSECIVTNDYKNANIFTNYVDSACVYVNVSTRFTDGGELGFGCEMGISTQKMHVRGPFALEHLVSSKYVITGDGQIRG